MIVPDEPPEEDAETEVWDVNWAAVSVFMACGTQWRVVAGGQGFVRTGLDYAGVEVVMRRLAPAGADLSQLFGDLLVMEAAALPIINEAAG